MDWSRLRWKTHAAWAAVACAALWYGHLIGKIDGHIELVLKQSDDRQCVASGGYVSVQTDRCVLPEHTR